MVLFLQYEIVMKKIMITGSLICLTLISIWTVYRLYSKTTSQGVQIKPTAEIICNTPVFCLQNDEEWADHHLGQSRFVMKSSGCLTTSMAAALELQKKADQPGFQLTPVELNRLFSQHQVYNDNGDIVWGRINDAVYAMRCVYWE